ncbi:MAG: hypothetical protein IV298_15815 [Cylindrospermopsis raciborskii KL1]|uniref:hypothetical protein n=1 Tax=Cylindrospermopsis raciborskii TaxID=77022 RepID=UPI001A2A0B4D|nr:hypothetical protein [Cylindrospermopsis raciborskii]MBG0744899.1 hypothetical protein [Cylindrospermopsis raciborskii KL1]
MKHQLAKLLFDAENACKLILEFTEGKSYSEYSSARAKCDRPQHFPGEKSVFPGGNVGCLMGSDPPQPPLKRGAFRLNILYNNTLSGTIAFL